MADLTLTPAETYILSKDKVAKRFKRANNNNTMVILQLVLKYIAPDKETGDADLIKFLLLNNQAHEHLCYQVWKQALLFEQDIDYLNRKRNKIWFLCLGISYEKKDYYAFRDKVLSKDENQRIFEVDG